MSAPFTFRHFTDLHLHPHRYGATVDRATGRNSRLQAGVEVLREILTAQHALAPHRSDLLLFGGDLFEQRGLLPTSAVVALLAELEAADNTFPNGLPGTCRAVAGNHDMTDSGSESALHILETYGFMVADRLTVEHRHDCILVMAPYQSVSTDEVTAALEAISDRDKPVILLAHNGLSGPHCKEIPGEVSYQVGALRLATGHLTGFLGLFGHWHWPAEWPRGITGMGNPDRFACVQTGSPMQLTWADAGSARGYLDGKWDGSMWQLRAVPIVTSPRFVDLDVDPYATVTALDFVRVTEGNPAAAGRNFAESPALAEIRQPEEIEEKKGRADLRLSATFDETIQAFVDHTLPDVDADVTKRLARLGRDLIAASAPVER